MVVLAGCGQTQYTAETVRPADVCTHEKMSEAECTDFRNIFARDQELWGLFAPIMANSLNGAPQAEILAQTQTAMEQYLTNNRGLLASSPTETLNAYSLAIERAAVALKNYDPNICARWMTGDISAVELRGMPHGVQSALTELGVAAIGAITAAKSSPQRYAALSDRDWEILADAMHSRGYTDEQLERAQSPNAPPSLMCAAPTSLVQIANRMPPADRPRFIAGLIIL
jgi:hypothetical protein